MQGREDVYADLFPRDISRVFARGTYTIATIGQVPAGIPSAPGSGMLIAYLGLVGLGSPPLWIHMGSHLRAL